MYKPSASEVSLFEVGVKRFDEITGTKLAMLPWSTEVDCADIVMLRRTVGISEHERLLVDTDRKLARGSGTLVVTRLHDNSNAAFPGPYRLPSARTMQVVLEDNQPYEFILSSTGHYNKPAPYVTRSSYNVFDDLLVLGDPRDQIELLLEDRDRYVYPRSLSTGAYLQGDWDPSGVEDVRKLSGREAITVIQRFAGKLIEKNSLS